jgi:CheY-like chemotaxis protein
MVVADPGQIEQVVLNLAVNARDAMADGGTLTIETATAELDREYVDRHASVAAGLYVMLAVADTGTGMDAATQKRIFEPFFTTKEIGKGTGMGLSTVYGIVKQSGGHIWVYSEPGRGATFKVYLPIADAASPRAAAPHEAEPEVRAGTETVLLAEDEESVRLFTRTILERSGYRVIDATNPLAALDTARRYEGPIDLLLTDVVMPGASGTDLYRRLRATRPALKVLYMSGYTDDSVVRRGVLDKGAPFLQKPFTGARLVRKVRSVLDS